jgi:hypothetical protein
MIQVAAWEKGQPSFARETISSQYLPLPCRRLEQSLISAGTLAHPLPFSGISPDTYLEEEYAICALYFFEAPLVCIKIQKIGIFLKKNAASNGALFFFFPLCRRY